MLHWKCRKLDDEQKSFEKKLVPNLQKLQVTNQGESSGYLKSNVDRNVYVCRAYATYNYFYPSPWATRYR
jgi:hypothetical protein